MSIGAAVMLVAGYSGWAHFCNPFLGFAVVMAEWFFILLELLMGEAGQVAASGDKVCDRRFHHIIPGFAVKVVPLFVAIPTPVFTYRLRSI